MGHMASKMGRWGQRRNAGGRGNLSTQSIVDLSWLEEEHAEEDTYGHVKLLKHLNLKQTHEKRMNLQTAKHRKVGKGPEGLRDIMDKFGCQIQYHTEEQMLEQTSDMI